MSDRDGYPAGVPCWVDALQPDPDSAAGFYADPFGWEVESRMPPDSPGFRAAILDDPQGAALTVGQPTAGP